MRRTVLALCALLTLLGSGEARELRQAAITDSIQVRVAWHDEVNAHGHRYSVVEEAAIEVREGATVVQRISMRDWQAEPEDLLRAESIDLDFDGHADLRWVFDWGAGWCYYRVWLYNAKTGRFVHDSLARQLEKLENLDLDHDRSEVIGHGWRGRPYGWTERYRIAGRHLVLIERCRCDKRSGAKGPPCCS